MLNNWVKGVSRLLCSGEYRVLSWRVLGAVVVVTWRVLREGVVSLGMILWVVVIVFCVGDSAVLCCE